MTSNAAHVNGNGLVITQKPVADDWAEECKTVCQRPGPTTIKDIHRTLENTDIGPDGLVYTKTGLGLTDTISVKVNMPSLCGPGTHWNTRLKQCVHDKVPSSICGKGTRWDGNNSTCIRDSGCQKGFAYSGDVCLLLETPHPPSAHPNLHVIG